MPKVKVRKRHFLLLEVIIAFLLIVICIIPLIYPHSFILEQQKKFIHKVELDHIVNLIYADVIEKLYTKDIPWSAIASGYPFDVNESTLKDLGYEKAFPFNGGYQFRVIKRKPNDESPYIVYLLGLNFQFLPKDTKERTPEEDSKPITYRYSYEIMLIRDLNEGQLPPGEPDEEGNPNGEQNTQSEQEGTNEAK